jgi:isopenicillin N synthase-like dioxygenase
MPYAAEIKEKLYAKVTYPPELRALMQQVDLWRQFCELPTNEKMRFAFPDQQVGRKDPGYKERERSKGREDKWYFHYTGEVPTILAETGLDKTVAADPLLAEFFTFCQKIYASAQALAVDIAKDLEAEVPGIAAEVAKGQQNMIMRLLYYVPQNASDMSLADPHMDRSGYTLHLFESHPGLELMDFDGNWKPAPMGAGHTIVFGAWQLQKKSNDQLTATWHRVRRIPGVNDVTPRYSIVFFVPLVDTAWYPNDDRFQNLVPGYGRRPTSTGPSR